MARHWMTKQRDAAALLGELRHALEQRFEGLPALPMQQRSDSVRELVLALELRWKLEEQLLFPALSDAFGGDHGLFETDEEDLDKLREIGELVLAGATSPLRQDVLLKVLEGATRLHLERVDGLLHQVGRQPGIDWLAMGDEMQTLLARWRREVLITGDIEDEERDPVGLRPR